MLSDLFTTGEIQVVTMLFKCEVCYSVVSLWKNRKKSEFNTQYYVVLWSNTYHLVPPLKIEKNRHLMSIYHEVSPKLPGSKL